MKPADRIRIIAEHLKARQADQEAFQRANDMAERIEDQEDKPQSFAHFSAK